MKLVASILLFVFSLTVTLPVAQALLAKNQISLFVVDEEKSGSNELNEIKEEHSTTGVALCEGNHQTKVCL